MAYDQYSDIHSFDNVENNIPDLNLSNSIHHCGYKKYRNFIRDF